MHSADNIFSSYLIFCNFKICNVDHYLFTKCDDINIILILVYVDDIIITENNSEQIRIKLRNKKKF